MANAPTQLTQEDFLADRQKSYALFGGMTKYGTILVVLIVVGMAIFLL
jgi:hypothetical protein